MMTLHYDGDVDQHPCPDNEAGAAAPTLVDLL
jgi:hypothetical protein